MQQYWKQASVEHQRTHAVALPWRCVRHGRHFTPPLRHRARWPRLGAMAATKARAADEDLIHADVDVAVVGGGPAGLVTARALRTVLGPACIQVYDTRLRNTERGASLGLQVNGMRALEAIDPCLAHKAYEVGIYGNGIVLRNEITEELLPAAQQRPRDPMASLAEHGHCVTMIFWQDLVDLLADSLPPGTLHNGWKLVEAEEMPVSEPGVEEHRAGGGRGGDTCACASAGADGQQLLAVQDGNGQQRASCGAGVAGGGVGADLGRMPYRYRLRFASSDPEHGAPTEESRGEEQQGQEARGLEVRAKVVIGADGYFSRVRRVLVDGGSPTFSGMVAWWGSLTEQQAAEGGVDTWPEGLGEPRPGCFGHCCYLGEGRLSMVNRTGRGTVAWYLRAQVEDLRRAGLEYPYRSHGPVALDRALRTFSHLPAPVRRVLAATPPARVTERGLHMHDFGAMGQGSWVRGGVCLVGDAAHCGRPDGQGANLALEDAAELAARVREHGLGEQAFRTFESSRLERVRTILCDAAPPFAVRTPLVLSASFAPLWSPADLPVPVGSMEEGLAWSRGVVRETVERGMGSGA